MTYTPGLLMDIGGGAGTHNRGPHESLGISRQVLEGLPKAEDKFGLIAWRRK